jgi:hypothetical protein
MMTAPLEGYDEGVAGVTRHLDVRSQTQPACAQIIGHYIPGRPERFRPRLVRFVELAPFFVGRD